MKAPRVCSDRAMTSNCVRFDDKRGWSCRLNKTGLRSLVRKKLFSYYVKCYEQVCRGESESAVLKKFEIFRSVSQRFPPLTPLPVGFGLLEPLEKQSTLMQLVSEQLDDAERIYLQLQADYPDDMQVGEGSISASEGVANTPLPLDDSSLQNVPLGGVRSAELPAVPPGFTLGLGSYTLSQLDNPEGRPPPSSRQCQSMSDMESRASRYPDMLPKLERLKQQLILFDNELKGREMNERLSLKLRRRSLDEIPSRLPEGILAEDSQNRLKKASMEGFQDVGFQGCYYPASIETPMPHDEEEGLLRHRSISEALEVVPRLIGRYRKNVGDIRPAVYGGSADGNLPSKTIMEGFSPQASDLQVSDLCNGGENFVVMPNPGENNTLQIVPIDPSFSAEPFADDGEQWAECQLWQLDMHVEESWAYLWPSPVRHVSIDTLPA